MATVGDEFFDDAIPVVGTVRGARVWRVEDDGVLTGVTYRQPWTQGENVAHCVFSAAGKDGQAEYPEHWYRAKWNPTVVSSNVRRDKHHPGALGCTCGFFSYHEGDGMEWAATAGYDRHVGGVVHVYGRMTRGSKGFRAEKARIVALTVPRWSDLAYGGRDDPEVFERRRAEGIVRWEAVRTRYPDVPVYGDVWTALAAHPLSAA